MKKRIIVALLTIFSTLSISKYSYTQRTFQVDPPISIEDKEFLSYVDRFGKDYNSKAEFEFRREIFKRNK